LINILKIKKMGLIKEPEGIDFVVKSRTLTKAEEIALSKFIAESKIRDKKKSLVKKITPKNKKAVV